nr:type II toxin-antitoxin system VapC family toxin [Agromyces seonyuensis]
MLDTNIVIFALRNRTPVLRERMHRVSGFAAVSTITVAELHEGVWRSADPTQARAAVDGLLALVDVLDFDQAAAAHAGGIRAALRTAGTPIGPFDTLLAGHARSAGLTMVTNNVREFARVDGLRVEDWSEPAT